MALSKPISCPHELRPGTTVCLHCRRAAREAASARTRAFVGKVVLVSVLIAMAGAAGFASFGALRGEGLDVREIAARLTPSATQAAAAVTDHLPTPIASPGLTPEMSTVAGAPAPVLTDPAIAVAGAAALVAPNTIIAPDQAVSLPVAPSAVAPAPPPPVEAPSPVVAEGHTDLPDSMFAVRKGDTVTVRFDTDLARTRRPEKFEQIVRATLPRVHGALADSLLARLPAGDLARHGDLLTELPLRGIRLDALNGLTMTLWPETRPGRDGPLVVAYRTTVSR
jgi:hypothetical protein